jgi:hypothetical protein
MGVTVAVRREILPEETFEEIRKFHGHIDLFCAFESVAYLTVYHPFSMPPKPGVHDPEPRNILRRFEKIKILIR